jgi:hypothetical protein
MRLERESRRCGSLISDTHFPHRLIRTPRYREEPLPDMIGGVKLSQRTEIGPVCSLIDQIATEAENLPFMINAIGLVTNMHPHQ